MAVALEHGAAHKKLTHIDTALCYGTHRQVGHVLADYFMRGKLQRNNVFLTSKIFHPDNDGFGLDVNTLPKNTADLSPEETTRMVTEQFERTLQELGVGYVDLMLLHWPGGQGGLRNEEETKDDDTSALQRRHLEEEITRNAAHRLAAWKVLEKFYRKGWARAIGVSNFNEIHLERLRQDGAEIVPMVNQIEASVFLQQTEIAQYCQQRNISLVAYSPLGRGVNHVTPNPLVQKIATKHGKDAGQVALRYCLQKGYAAVIFWSTSEKRIVSNHDILQDFSLEDDDMAKLDSLNAPDGSWGLPSPYDIP